MTSTRRAFLSGGTCVALLAGQDPKAANPVAKEPSFAEIPLLPPLPAEQDTGRFAGRRWMMQRLVDSDDTSAVLNDIRFASAERGIAVGAQRFRDKEEPQALLTRDGGKSWNAVKLKDWPVSLCVLDESRAYFIGREALWFTDEGGAVWEKRKLPKERGDRPMIRVHFFDEERGFLFGGGKTFYSTEDGGMTWRKVPESEALNLKDENTIWTWMNQVDGKMALIVGLSASPPRDVSRFPDWMMPERAVRRNLTPATTVLGETRDAGKTWKMGVSSAFGRVTRLRTLGSRGLVLYQYGDGIEFPSEVYAIDLSTGRSRPFFRRRDVWVHDVVPLHDGGALLAAIEPPGRLRSTPIPGRLRIFHTPNGERWYEMKVDYHASGRRAYLSRVDDNNIWAATDEGMILNLAPAR